MSPNITIVTAVILASVAVNFASAGPSTRQYAEGVTQPQGNTGPLDTKSGGAPASSPQGETPPGMQSAPKGSAEPIHTDKSGMPEGTPKN